MANRSLKPPVPPAGLPAFSPSFGSCPLRFSPMPAYKGMSYTSFGADVLSGAPSDQSLYDMSVIGANHRGPERLVVPANSLLQPPLLKTIAATAPQ